MSTDEEKPETCECLYFIQRQIFKDPSSLQELSTNIRSTGFPGLEAEEKQVRQPNGSAMVPVSSS